MWSCFLTSRLRREVLDQPAASWVTETAAPGALNEQRRKTPCRRCRGTKEPHAGSVRLEKISKVIESKLCPIPTLSRSPECHVRAFLEKLGKERVNDKTHQPRALASKLVKRGLVQIPVSMYQTVVTSLAQGNGPVQVAMAPVTTRIADTAVTMDGQAVEVVTLDQ
ncbi:hypothetical protein DUI87_33319 [Hirundo rustica rustica]|uniref:Uncharacterized protein n=1 Tax=Hirundo rustica rustica TaxID=333673 RepID=A0A3M0J6S4_HIRRU|nr:hypothetical protein DUI87_33319 [Hirundo rustica rustica]